MRLDAAVAGKVALVSLWATWCEACREEFGALSRLDAAARARGAVVLSVAEGEGWVEVADFVARKGLRWRQLVDEELRLGEELGSRRVPATLVVNRAGRVVFVGGAFDDAALAAFRAALSD